MSADRPYATTHESFRKGQAASAILTASHDETLDAQDAQGAKPDAPADQCAADNESISHQKIELKNIELMKRIKARDESALEELYDRYAGSVYAVARKVLQHASDAEEVTVDTFWEIWRKADRFEASRGTLVRYLLLLARSRAIDKSRRVQSLELASGQIQPIDGTTVLPEDESAMMPDADLLHMERWVHIHCLLATLPQEQRQAIEMNFLEGMSHKQISIALGVPLGTTKTRIRQGLMRLHDEQMRLNEGDPDYDM